jgi:predicted phosphodiesterase
VRTALLSDIHGNAVALRAVLADLERHPVDQSLCLGDVVQGGAQPAEALELLRGLGCPVVMGNADDFVLDPAAAENSTEAITERQLEVRAWTLEQLSEDELDTVRAFPPTVGAELGDGRTLLAAHGSPASYDDLLFPTTLEDEFRRLLAGADADVVAGGHVHLPFLRRLGAQFFVNPGSIGLGYDHEQPDEMLRFDPWAAYAVIDVEDGRLAVDFRRVPFDPHAVAAALLESDMPYAGDSARRWVGH